MSKQEQAKEPEFAIQKIYIRDISFESPHATDMFLLQSQEDWQPQVSLDLNIETKDLQHNDFEVVLKVIVTVKIKDKIAFLVEANQAGIFTLANFPTEDLKAMIGAVCPNILFPYAREIVSDLITRGGFPPLYLAPVNFDALYQQQLEQEKEKK